VNWTGAHPQTDQMQNPDFQEFTFSANGKRKVDASLLRQVSQHDKDLRRSKRRDRQKREEATSEEVKVEEVKVERYVDRAKARRLGITENNLEIKGIDLSLVARRREELKCHPEHSQEAKSEISTDGAAIVALCCSRSRMTIDTASMTARAIFSSAVFEFSGQSRVPKIRTVRRNKVPHLVVAYPSVIGALRTSSVEPKEEVVDSDGDIFSEAEINDEMNDEMHPQEYSIGAQGDYEMYPEPPPL